MLLKAVTPFFDAEADTLGEEVVALLSLLLTFFRMGELLEEDGFLDSLAASILFFLFPPTGDPFKDDAGLFLEVEEEEAARLLGGESADAAAALCKLPSKMALLLD